MNKKFVVKEIKTLTEGKHNGVIVNIEYRDEPYNYADMIIEAEGATLKCGYPAFVAKDSKLGTLLERFGATITVGAEIELEKVLVGKKCTFLTMMEKNVKNGKTYTKIISDTLKPLA